MGYLDTVRTIRQQVILNGETYIDDGLISCTVEQVGVSQNKLTMGDFCKCSAKIVYRGEPLSWAGSRFQVVSVLTDDETEQETLTSLGYFYTNNVEYDGVSYTVTGYDVTDQMSQPYDTTNGLTSSTAIVNQICTDTGMEFAEGTTWTEFEITSVYDGATNMQMLAYIAGVDGKSVRVNADGLLEKYWFSSADVVIPRNAQYEQGLSNNVQFVTINSVTSGTNEAPLTAGEGYGIVFDNPYITQEQVNAIYNEVVGLTYAVAEVKYRGNPEYAIGDIVQVETITASYIDVPIMSHTFNCDGGMNATIKSYDNQEEQAVMAESPVDRKITLAYKQLTEEFRTALANVAGITEGYFSILYDEGATEPYGWQILDTPTLRPDSSGWRWTNGGLVHTTNGFNTISDIAITADGHIAGQFLTAQSVSMEALNVLAKTQIEGVFTNMEFNDESGGLVIAKKDTEGNIISSYNSLFSDTGMRVRDSSTGAATLIAEKDSVQASNLTANNFLIIDVTTYGARFQQFSDSYDANQLGCYWILPSQEE